jgi:hypothetical protein
VKRGPYKKRDGKGVCHRSTGVSTLVFRLNNR